MIVRVRKVVFLFLCFLDIYVRDCVSLYNCVSVFVSF